MEEEMSVATDVPRRQLVFIYSYGMGGWGDLLKGLHTCWCWAKATDRELHIDFGQHVFGDIFPAYKTEYTYDRTLSLIDAGGKVSVEQIAALEDSTIGIYCNWFSPLSVKGIPPSIILGFFDAVYRDIFPLPAKSLSSDTYDVFHCRMGDKYLNEAYACKGDNRMGSMASILEKLSRYKATRTASHSLVCSDHASMIRSLLQQIPNSSSICNTPYHIAYFSPTIHTQIGNIRDMIAEHRAMSKAQSIWMANYSGFPITASAIGNVPLLLAGETYHDEYVDYIWSLRNMNE